MANAIDFATRLRGLREQAGLSQYALAKRAGISKQAVSKLEEGGREPSFTTVQLLAKVLGVTCEALADPQLSIPPAVPAPKRGRPRKEDKPESKGRKKE